MIKKFKYKPLAIVIASALSMYGCGSSDSDSNSTLANNTDTAPISDVIEANTDMARVKLAVKFPQADASAAWVGDSKTIEVSFFNTKTLGSIEEVKAAYDARCTVDFDWQNHCSSESSDVLRGQFATSVSMNSDTPTAFIDLLPGKYRIEAKFSNAQGKHQETSVSYVTLSKGEHSLKLRGLEATWTATAQMNLQLLNQVTDYDWDPQTEGIQTAAQKIGITGAITGLHLPTVLTYPDGYLTDQNKVSDVTEGQAYNQTVLINAGVTNIEQLGKEAQATAFQPVLRISDPQGGEYNLLPRFIITGEEGLNEQDVWEASGSWNNTGLAILQQEYTSEGDNARLSLGGYYMGYWDYNNQTNSDNNHSASLEFGTSSLPDGDATATRYDIVYEQGYFYNEATNSNVSYDIRDSEKEALKIVRLKTDTNFDDSESSAYWQQLFIDLQGTRNEVVDGSTITGYLIETETHYTRVFGDESSDTGVDTQPTNFLEAALVEIAEQEGLIANGATDETCRTQAISGLEYSNDYQWDAEQNGWVAGTYNEFMTEDGLLARIDQEITSNTTQLETAQSDLDAAQAELAVYDSEIVAIVEAEMTVYNSTITEIATIATEIETIVSDNSTVINNYETALADYQSATDAVWGENGTYNAYNAAYDQVSLYEAGQLPDCDTTCYDLLVQARDSAQSEYSDSLQLEQVARDQKDLMSINYDIVKQSINDLIEPYSLYVNTYESDDFITAVNVALQTYQGEQQTRLDQWQTTLDEIASNSNISNYGTDNWELYDNRSRALWPVTNASNTVDVKNAALIQLTQLKADALATADLNNDGEVTIFEAGVYATGNLDGYLYSEYLHDQTTGQFTQNHSINWSDFEIKDTVKATSMTGEQTICVQPFTLKASQLSIEYDTAADVIIE